MSNLSELLPAGGAAKEFEAVASGTLANGQAVVLNSDGTVAAISGTSASQSVGSAQTVTSTNPILMSSAYDSAEEKTVIVYSKYTFGFPTPPPAYGYAVVVTTTGTTVSLGTPVVFASYNLGQARPTATVYDENSGKIVIFYCEDGSYTDGSFPAYAVVGTVSGTSISFGSRVSVDPSLNVNYLSAAYDSTNNKVAVFFRDELSSNRAEARVGTVSGTSISFGGPTVFNSQATTYITSVFDPDTGKVVVGYRDSNGYGTSIVGTVSGTSISFGTEVVFNSATTTHVGVCYDSTNNKVVLTYKRADGTNYGGAVVGTVSGTSISYGANVDFYANTITSVVNSFDSNSGKVIIAYAPTSGAAAYTTQIISGLVSGTSISFPDAAMSVPNSSTYQTVVYDASALISVIGFRGTSTTFKAATIQPAYSSTNSANFIGITQEAIANTATGLVTPQGGVNTSVSSLTAGTDYYVQDDGTLSTTVSSVPAGRALSTTSILLEG